MPRHLRHALRTLVRSPGFSVLAVVTLALGIGANAALFTIVDSVVLRPLPYEDSERLAVLRHPVPGVGQGNEWGISVAGYFFFREHSRTFEEMGAYVTTAATLAGDGPPERAEAAIATETLLRTLGARAVVGRLYTPEEAARARVGVGVVVLGHDFWRRRYGGDPGVIGQSLEVNGTMHEIVGVVQRGLQLPDRQVDLWVPLGLDPSQPATNSHFLWVIARLRPQVTVGAAETELRRLADRFPEEFPQAYSQGWIQNTGFTVRVRSLRDEVIGGIGRALWILLGSVGLVLLIACANVANLFLVRTEGRRREVSLRAALGASRGDLARLFLTESVALALIAGMLALVLTVVGIRALLVLAPPTLPRLNEIGIGAGTVGFTVVLSLIAGLLFGSFPLLRFGSGISPEALREGGRGMTPGRARLRTRNILVAGQVALALVLLIGAGLMLQSFRHLRSIEPGFDAAGVLTLDIALPWARYMEPERAATFFHQLTAAVEDLRGVERAGVVSALPLAGTPTCYALSIEQAGSDPRSVGCIALNLVTPGYFAAMQTAVQGRDFERADSERRGAVVVVSRSLAARLWPGEDPIGKGIKPFDSWPPYYRVVGVAEDVRSVALDAAAPEMMYVGLLAMEGEPAWGLPRSLTLVVRTTVAEPATLTTEIRRLVASLDPTAPVANVQSMQHVVDRSMVRTSFTMLLLGIAAAVALVLGAVGIFGVISFVVGQRRTEIGVRMALGAQAAEVRRMVMGQSLRLVLTGVVIGALVALGATRVLGSLLFEVSATDPLVFGTVTAVLIAVALLASYLPAARAARVDPTQTLRGD